MKNVNLHVVSGKPREHSLRVRDLTASYASLCKILRTPALRELVLGPRELEFNEMELAPTLGREALVDAHHGLLRERCELKIVSKTGRGLRFQPHDIRQAVLQVAYEKRYHPVREYLTEQIWHEGQPSVIAEVAERILHIEPTALTQAILRRWFISAVARPLKPGCKVDTVLVLVGRQGIGKSSFFRVLASPSWFSDSSIDLGGKDALMLMRRIWIYEWSELSAMQRTRDIETVKAFITSLEDCFRPPYGHAPIAVPRTSIIVGTTNNREFLADPSGNRRYWPLEVTEPIDLEELALMREDLWAEAVAAHNAGEPWYLTAEQEVELAEIHRRHEYHDPWEEPVLSFARADLRPLTTSRILDKALQKPTGQWTNADQKRVAAILRQAGWREGRTQIDDSKVRVWTAGPAGTGSLDPATTPTPTPFVPPWETGGPGGLRQRIGPATSMQQTDKEPHGE